MGYVTKTISQFVGELNTTTSYHFESYDDFIKFEDGEDQASEVEINVSATPDAVEQFSNTVKARGLGYLYGISPKEGESHESYAKRVKEAALNSY